MDEIIKRLEGATGPDREIDAAIQLRFQEANEHYKEPWRQPILLAREHQRPGVLEYVEISGVSARAAPAFTGDLNAITKLVEKWLPGCGWCLDAPNDENRRQRPSACISQSEALWTYDGWRPERGATPAIALCIAFIRAQNAIAISQ